jgi:tRNA(fMet)-specific endonuclease VapC
MIKKSLPGNAGWPTSAKSSDVIGLAKLASTRFSAAVEAWLAGFEVRPWPVEARAHYASIRAAREKTRQVIGGMDLLIAAHALAEDSALVTNNARKFLRVPGLSVQEWGLDQA